jgi:hypothetical protein
MQDEEIIKCHRCGRHLTAKRSISRMYGPICWKKIQDEIDIDILLEEARREALDE